MSESVSLSVKPMSSRFIGLSMREYCVESECWPSRSGAVFFINSHRRKLPPNSGGLMALSFPSPSLPSPSLSSHPLPSPPSPSLPSPLLRSMAPQIQLGGLGERCKLPQRGLGQSPSRNRIWCILALKSVIWWQHFNYFRKSQLNLRWQ